jgi:hypothetical protein
VENMEEWLGISMKKKKKAKRCREATFIWCQTQLSGEINLKI